MTIREMLSTDRAEVFAMMRTFYDSPALLTKVPDDVLRRNISTCISNSPYLEGFVFEHNQQTIGYGMVATSYSTERGGLCVWLEDIFIQPAFRGRGYGSTFSPLWSSALRAWPCATAWKPRGTIPLPCNSTARWDTAKPNTAP